MFFKYVIAVIKNKINVFVSYLLLVTNWSYLTNVDCNLTKKIFFKSDLSLFDQVYFTKGFQKQKIIF